MAMRPRRGDGDGAAATPYQKRAGDGWLVFEDFKPTSEWQQDTEFHTLIIYLPGFVKEKLRVSTEGRNIIRVRGERPIGGNKWCRFLEDFQVPENSNMNLVRASFQEGILRITIAKKSVAHEPQEATLASQSLPADAPNKSDPNKGHGEVQPPIPADGKSSEPQKKPFEDTSRVAEEKSEKTTTEKEEKKMERRKELPEDEITDQKGKESKQEQGMQTSRAENGALAMEKYKKAVKGHAGLNDERQLLVNMGIAVLLIVAISAYATYKFVSGKDKN